MVENTNKVTRPSENHNNERDRKRFFNVICVIVLVFALIIPCVITTCQFTNSVSATVTINSVSSIDGKNPDGTPFSIMELFSDDTLSSAVEKLNGIMSVQELRSHLNVSDTLNGETFSEFEQGVLNGEEENNYFPTQYSVTYSTISEQIKYEGFGAQCKSLWRSLFLPSKTKILNVVLQSYIEQYSKAHLDYESLFDTDWDAIDSMDYYNRFDAIQKTVWRFQRFLQYKSKQNFTGYGNGAANGFYDLIVKLSQGPEKNIENFQAYITQHGVTNDKEELLRQFEYMQQLCQEEETRKTKEYLVLREAIEMYDSSTTKVVFIPALDGEDSFYMSRTKVGLDYLSEKADAAKIAADDAGYSAKHYIYLQNCFSNDYIIDDDGNRIQVKNTQAQRDHADKLYSALKNELVNFSAELQLLTSQGSQLQQEEIVLGNTYSNASIVSIVISLVKKYVLILTACFVVFYVYRIIDVKIKNKGKEETK
ncbi:MAG: hypothetical protein E7633_03685 [Ruminococcaceae bacterium]|nr:hypothetical protein [Oscillospiraceae bacterium]